MTTKNTTETKAKIEDIVYAVDDPRFRSQDYDYIDLMAYSIGKDVSIESAFEYIDSCIGKKGVNAAMDLAYVLLSSERHNREFMQLCEMGGILIEVHNLAMQSLMRGDFVSERIITDQLLESLGDIVEANSYRIQVLSKPHRGKNSDLLLDNMCRRSGDAVALFRTMGAEEMAGNQITMGKFGYPYSLAMSLHPLDPLGSIETLSHSEVSRFFDQLCCFIPRHEAQRKIDTFTKKSNDKVFLNIEDIEPMIPNGLDQFFLKTINSSKSFDKDCLRIVIGAHRNDGKLKDIDSVLGSDVDKLIKSSHIKMSDLDSMPLALKRNSRKKLSQEIGL